MGERHGVLYNESVEIGKFLNGGTGGDFEVFLFSLASLGALVSENEVNLKVHLSE